MKKIKEFLKVFIYPVILLASQFVSILLFTFIFNLTNNYEVGSNKYIENLSLFFSNNSIWIAVLTFLILIPIFKKKCNFNKLKVGTKDIIVLILIGISFAVLYNLILFNLNFTDIFNNNGNNKLFITLIASGLIGPIMEELIFRNIVYEKLKKNYKPIFAVILTGILFGLFHGNIIQFIYVFLFNFIFIMVYEKYDSIYAPIIVHISANSGLQLFLTFVNYQNTYINIFSLILSIILMFFTTKILINTRTN